MNAAQEPTAALGAQGQIQVHFTTSSPELSLPEEKRQLLVPTDIARLGLSQILNSSALLDTPSPIPLDFLINGILLRTTLAAYLASAGLSAETTLQIEYIRARIPPSYQASFEHDDWVSAVDVLSGSSATGEETAPQRILSASYDGLLRVWMTSGRCLATSAGAASGGHTSSIKAAKFLSPRTVVSAGLDRTVRVWKYNDDGASLKPTLELHGHRSSVDRIAVHGGTNRILTASTDGTVGLWSSSKTESPAAPEEHTPSQSSKRRKISSSVTVPSRGPLALMSTPSNQAPVTDVKFDANDNTVAYSTSLSHTITTHDLTTAATVSTRTLAHPLLCISPLPGVSTQVLATGTSARHISIIDPRQDARTAAVMTLRGHTNKVVAIAADPQSKWGLVSAGHEGVCRVWDLRSAREGRREEGGGRVGEAVFVIERENAANKERKVTAGEGRKVFDVAWDRDIGIVSAGEDKHVQINRGSGVTKVD